jgi:energy-coupling factor transporter ATP-binding protein EcfA2
MDLPEYLIDSDIRTLISAADDPRDHALLVVVLSTGLFLSELVALNLDSVDLDAKKLHIVGKRERTLDLTDTAVTALTHWLNARPKTPDHSLFVTERGVPKPLSDRSVDHIIRSAAKAAGMEKSVSYHVLRNTFIVRLLRKSDAKTAAKLLGVDRDALDRFDPILNPQSSPHAQADDGFDPFDTRSGLGKLVDIIHPTKPSVIPSSDVQPSARNPTMIGRDDLLKDATKLIQRNQSILFTGPAGIGKTHILKTLAETLPNAIFIASPVPFKTMLLEFAATICPSAGVSQRTSTPDILSAILDADSLAPPILIIDNIDRLKASEEDTMITLIDKFIIIGATDKPPNRLQSLWWKFQQLTVPPLNSSSTKALITHLTHAHSMNRHDYQLLETKVHRLANGNPFAVVELISQLPQSSKVNADHIRSIDHEAGIVYRDWTWILVVIWGLLVISRFIALGTHSFEGYILAGIGTSLFMVFKYFVKLKR